MSDSDKCYAATPAETLEQHITDSRIAKNDAEWWAHREILRLRAENEKLREQYDAGVAAWNPVYEIVLNERDALKAENEKLRAAAKEAQKTFDATWSEADLLRIENEEQRRGIEKLRAERDLWISRFEDFRKNAARLEEARSRPMRLVGSAAAAALKETGDE